MPKLKPRTISYDRFLFILSTINPNNSPTIDIGILEYQLNLNSIVASIGVSDYVVLHKLNFNEVLPTIKQNLQHITKYSIHKL